LDVVAQLYSCRDPFIEQGRLEQYSTAAMLCVSRGDLNQQERTDDSRAGSAVSLEIGCQTAQRLAPALCCWLLVSEVAKPSHSHNLKFERTCQNAFDILN
jgi:hypothetical protein